MSKGEEHQKQHYVPQCYLNYFGYHKRKKNSKEFFLYAYDVKETYKSILLLKMLVSFRIFTKYPKTLLQIKQQLIHFR